MLLPPVSHTAPNAAAVAGAGTTFVPPYTLPLPWLRIRRLGQDDRAALTRHLIGLPLADRCTRFGGPSADEAIRRHCDALDLVETICFAALDSDGVVVGAALGFDCGAGDGHCGPLVEVAVSVASEHRHCGLGADLVARVCATAAARGATGAVFEFHPRNAAIQGLIRRLGGRITPLAEVCVVPLPAPHGSLDPQESPGGAETGDERWDDSRSRGTDRAAKLAVA